MRVHFTGFVLSWMAIVSLVLLSGCTSQYMPKKSSQIRMVPTSGGMTYVRDGKIFEHGFTASGLVDAVSADPEALELAESARSAQIGGVIAVLVGEVLLLYPLMESLLSAGIPFGVFYKDDEVANTVFVISGLVVVTVGSVLISKSQAHIYDAINVYNDNVEDRYAHPLEKAKVIPVETETMHEETREEVAPTEEEAPTVEEVPPTPEVAPEEATPAVAPE